MSYFVLNTVDQKQKMIWMVAKFKIAQLFVIMIFICLNFVRDFVKTPLSERVKLTISNNLDVKFCNYFLTVEVIHTIDQKGLAEDGS